MTTPAPALHAALLALQDRLPNVRKGSRATVPGKDGRDGYSYSYADLGAVQRALLPRLQALGMTWTTMPTVSPSGFVLAYALTHAGTGEQITGAYPLPDPNRTTPQALGGAITYARRYALCCVTGLVPDKDDDAAASSTREVSSTARVRDKRNGDPTHDRALAQSYADRLRNITTRAALVATRRDAELAEVLDEQVSNSRGESLPLVDMLEKASQWLAEQERRRAAGDPPS